ALLAFREHGLSVSGPLFDTMIAHYLVEPESAHDMQTLTELFFGYHVMKDSEGVLADRLCEHADFALQLKQKLQPELEKRGHSSLMRDVEMPLVQVLAGMEYEGVTLDEDVLNKMSDDLKKDSEAV